MVLLAVALVGALGGVKRPAVAVRRCTKPSARRSPSLQTKCCTAWYVATSLHAPVVLCPHAACCCCCYCGWHQALTPELALSNLPAQFAGIVSGLVSSVVRVLGARPAFGTETQHEACLLLATLLQVPWCLCVCAPAGVVWLVAHAFVASLWTQRFVGVEEMVGRSNPALIDTLTVTGLTSHTTCGLLAAAAAHGSQFGADVGGGVTAFLSHVRDPQFAPMVAALLASPFNQHLQLRGVQYVRSLATQLRVLGHPARDRFVSSRDVERYSYLMLAMYFSVRQVCGVWCVWVGGWCGCCVAWAVALPIGSTGLTGGARLSDGSTLMPPWRRFVRCTKPSLVATPGARQ